MRTDLYTLVHKAQRYHLFALAQELSRADLAEPATCAALAERVRQIHALLLDHAENEARYIHPLLRELGVAAALDLEHHALEQQLGAWRGLVESQRWSELYRATMRLIGEYLLHIDAEERLQAEVLWVQCSEQQLQAVMTRFKREREPAAARADSALFAPALSLPELTALLRAAPEQVREASLAVVRGALEPERWQAITRAL